MTAILILLALVAVIAVAPLAAEIMRRPMNAATRAEAPGAFSAGTRGATHYQWHGPVRGPVAVLVHGLTTSSYLWQPLIAGLAGLGYRVLTYDLYGRGYSDRPGGVQDAAFFEDQLADLLRDQNVKDEVTLIGYSMGGAIATGFAARHADMIRHLVLIAPAGMGHSIERAAEYARDTPIIGDWLMLAGYPRRYRREVEAQRNAPCLIEGFADLRLAELKRRGYVAAILASLRGILNREFQDEHQAIHAAGIPVVAVWGRKDGTIPISGMGRLTKWARSTRQEVIEDADHGLPYTHPDRIVAAISESLRAGLI